MLFILSSSSLLLLLLLLFNYLFIFHSTPSDPRPATDSFLNYTSIFIGQTIPSFAVDTHPLLPMRTIFVTRLQGLLKIAFFLWVKLQVLDPVQLCQLR